MDFLKALLLATLLSSPAIASSLPASAFDTVTSLEGKTFQPKTEKVLLYFWATWCPSCKQKLLGELAKDPLPANSSLVTVNTDKEGGRTSHWVEKEGMRLTVVRDEKKSLVNGLKLFTVPSWAVLAKEKSGDWRVIDSDSGYDSARIKGALAKKVN